MSPKPSRIELLARAIVEGDRVDWTAVLDSALTADERRAIEQLRVVEGLGLQFDEARSRRNHRADGLNLDDAARQFSTTEWGLVLAAGGTDCSESREALASLCRRYWYPVYAEVRFAGHDAENARDLTQGFFLQLLERRALAVATPDRGKFRNFLKRSIKNYLSDEAARNQARKRGGDVSLIPLDLAAAEKQYARELGHSRTPERIFDRRWARALLERSLDRLRQEMEKAGSLERFERLAPLLTGSNDTTRYKDLALRWETTEAAIKMAVHRMRRRLRKLCRLEVAHTVDDSREVDAEIRFLLSVIES